MSTVAVSKCWTFASSKGNRLYQTILYVDGSTSCDCPGWCRRVAADGSRSCKHTRSVLMGTADRECQSKHESTTTSIRSTRGTSGTAVTQQFGEIGRRRIHV
ncbi:MAG: hypothetical protein EOP84_05960 [Verrucomicrobiaceae bacterium]|nr:MAG: hypothetical protein EOP84_05960 [Verrucomicrobiaceae bacterium]